MTLPSAEGGATTEQVGFFETDSETLSVWIQEGLSDGAWEIRKPACSSLVEAVAALQPEVAVSRYLCVPLGAWSVLLNNGLLGTDVGVLPSYAARELACRAIRAVSVGDEATYPARILEIYGPGGEPPLALERSIAAANDGGRWLFETSGTPLPFEDQDAYSRRSKASRFTPEMINSYLRALGVPIDRAPDWPGALMVERQ
ncbi:hypothetical protein [Pengzhenrongella phosphoraccumulans]|uniref:hypothetical protein n=1 Tax=Pengzhenrongella phosphoraccumulans TaxID=3114394 RepID=UPI00388E41D1